MGNPTRADAVRGGPARAPRSEAARKCTRGHATQQRSRPGRRRADGARHSRAREPERRRWAESLECGESSPERAVRSAERTSRARHLRSGRAGHRSAQADRRSPRQRAAVRSRGRSTGDPESPRARGRGGPATCARCSIPASSCASRRGTFCLDRNFLHRRSIRRLASGCAHSATSSSGSSSNRVTHSSTPDA